MDRMYADEEGWDEEFGREEAQEERKKRKT
jgi:hypothetical protein